MTIQVYAEPWKLTGWAQWIVFGVVIAFIILVFPAYYFIDKFFNNTEYDGILD